MSNDNLERAGAVLAGATEVALACHVNPDADALGSMLGLAAFLRSRGVRTVCSYPNEPLDPAALGRVAARTRRTWSPSATTPSSPP